MCTHCVYVCICVYGWYAALFGDLNFAVTATAATTNAALATTAPWLLLLLLLLLVLLPVHPPHPHCVLTSLYPRFYYFQIYHWPSAMKICDTTSPPAPSCAPPCELGWHGTWTWSPLFGAKVIHMKRKRKVQVAPVPSCVPPWMARDTEFPVPEPELSLCSSVHPILSVSSHLSLGNCSSFYTVMLIRVCR